MSQVKKILPKLQSGGKGPTLNEGIFEMDGRRIYGQRAFDELSKVRNTVDWRYRMPFGDAENALRDGMHVRYSAGAPNGIQVFDLDGNDISDKYINTKASTEDSWLRRTHDAIWENDRHNYKIGLSYFQAINMEDEPVKPVITPKTKLTKGNEWWAYHTNEDGSRTYIINSPNNEAKLEHLRGLIRGYFDDENPDTLAERYDTTAYTPEELNAFRSFYKQFDTPESRDQYWNSLFDAIKNDTLSEGQREQLKLFGYQETPKTPVTTNPEAPIIDNDPKPGEWNYIDPSWTGNRKALSDRGFGIIRDGNGWRVTWNPELGDIGYHYLGGYDEFANTEFSDGFILDNGRLVRGKDTIDPDLMVLSPKERQALSVWKSALGLKNYQDRYNRRIASGIKFKNDRNGLNPEEAANYYGPFSKRYDISLGYNPLFQTWFTQNGARNYLPITGAYNVEPGIEILNIIDDDTTNFTEGGMEKPRFLVYNLKGNKGENDPYYLFDSEKDMLDAIMGTPKTGQWSYDTYWDWHPWLNINGKNYAKILQFGEGDYANTIILGQDGNYYLAKKSGDSFINPELFPNQNTPKDIIANPDKYKTYKYNELLNINYKPTVNYNTAGRSILDAAHRQNSLKDNNWLNSLVMAGITSKKQGGVIPKYQTGGVADSHEAIFNNITLDSSTATNISRDHALDGSDGGPTPDEMKLIEAAALDLGGAALALTGNPILGAVGAGAGARGSYMRYKHDLKNGADKGKAAKKLAFDLGLDVTSAVPIIGTGSSAIRAVRVIKSIAPVALRLLSVAGAAAPVITAIQRVANDEKYTHKDLATAIQGVGSLAFAIKSYRQLGGKAKLAMEGEKTAIEAGKKPREYTFKVKETTPESTAADGTVTPAITKDVEKKLKMSDIELSKLDGKTEKQAKEAIISRVKQELNVDIDEPKAAEILKTMDVDFKKGKLRFRKDASWKTAFLSKGDKRATVDKPLTQPSKRSLAGYIFDPFARARGLKAFDATFNKNFTPQNVNELLSKPKYTSRDKALIARFTDSPQKYGDMFVSGTKETFFGPKTVYSPIQRSWLWTRPMYRSPIVPEATSTPPVSVHKKGGKILKGETGVPPYFWWTNTDGKSNRGIDYPGSPMSMALDWDDIIEPLAPTEEVVNPVEETVTPTKNIKETSPTTQKGSTPNSTPSTRSYDFNSTLEPFKNLTTTYQGYLQNHIPEITIGGKKLTEDITVSGGTLGEKGLEGAKIASGKFENFDTGSLVGARPTLTNQQLVDQWNSTSDKFTVKLDSKGNIVKDTDIKPKSGGIIGRIKNLHIPNNFDFWRRTYDVAEENRRYGYEKAGNNAQYGRVFLSDWKTYINPNLSAIERGTDQELNALYNTKLTTSDGKMALAQNLGLSEEASKIRARGTDRMIAETNRTNLYNTQAGDYNISSGINAANLSNQHRVNTDTTGFKLDADHTARNWAINAGYLQQKGQQNWDSWTKRKDLELNKATLDAQAEASQKFDREVYKFRNEYNTNADKTKYPSFYDWLYAPENSEILRQYQTKELEYKQQVNNKIYLESVDRAKFDDMLWFYPRKDSMYNSGVISAKSGTKMRSYIEDIILENNKASKRAMQKMSDHLMKMLQQLMK